MEFFKIETIIDNVYFDKNVGNLFTCYVCTASHDLRQKVKIPILFVSAVHRQCYYR